MGITRHDEVERKYDVAPELPLPALTGVDGVASMGQQETLDLESVYFDTAGLDLHRRGMSLRRRTGGPDDGWHLKLPREGDRRTELQIPLGRAVRTVPARLVDPVRAVVRDRALGPVATVTTHRLQQSVLDPAGAVIAILCDDQVQAENLQEPDDLLAWREVELELAVGQPPDLLALLEVPLLDSGATPSASTSKLRRVLGDLPVTGTSGKVSAGPGARRRHQGRSKVSAAEVFLHHLEDQAAAVQRHDRGVRAGEDRSVHRLRIAVRRLRSALRTYQPLMPPGATDRLRDELRWLGQSLAPARDAQVLRQRLDHLIAQQPTALVLGPVSGRVDRDLAAAHRAGLKAAKEAMSSERYYRLLDALDDLLQSPQWSDAASKRADKVLPNLLHDDARALRRSARRARKARGDDHDVALHDVRKKAKRLRYGAESAEPALGAAAAKLAKRAKRAQSALGDHQDSVVARAALRHYGVEAHADGANSFTFGRLHALEEERARLAEESFHAAMGSLRPRDVRRSLKQ